MKARSRLPSRSPLIPTKPTTSASIIDCHRRVPVRTAVRSDDVAHLAAGPDNSVRSRVSADCLIADAEIPIASPRSLIAVAIAAIARNQRKRTNLIRIGSPNHRDGTVVSAAEHSSNPGRRFGPAGYLTSVVGTCAKPFGPPSVGNGSICPSRHTNPTQVLPVMFQRLRTEMANNSRSRRSDRRSMSA
jgi:hypothetical protein